MNMISLREFVSPFYEEKDIMHDLSHIERVLKVIKKLVINYEDKIDIESIIYASYFHGIIMEHESEINYWMKSNGFSQAHIDYIIKISKESQIDGVPETIDAKILHDAHLLEGGKAFMTIKYFVWGCSVGYSFEETIKYIETKIMKNCKCYLPETEELHGEMIKSSQQILDDLKQGLNLL